ncbi:MAG TPA: hypothetical protein VMF50_14175 [Candidatus Binataceae bacterium]|nr:hypothetical protein [Candidatus Binataceae bacterium]
MNENGQRHSDNEELEQRIYQVLALLERAGEQQCAAAELVTRASALQQRLDQAMQIASSAAARRIAEEAHVALEGTVADAAENLRQAARGAVAAAENLRQPWWVHLVMIVMTGIFSATLAFWATHTSDFAAYQQDQRNQQLIREGQMLERVWPKLTPAQRKRLEQLDNE